MIAKRDSCGRPYLGAPVLGESQRQKLEVVGPICSVPAGFGHRQVSTLPLVVVKTSDALSDVGEEPVSLGKEDRSKDLHPFEVVDGFVLQRQINYHLQQYLSIGVEDCCSPPVNELVPKVEGICGLLITCP